MWSGFPLFPEEASTLAAKVDMLYLFLVGVTLLFSLGIAAVLIAFAIKYRRRSEADRPAEIHGSLLLELAWSVVPFFIVVAMFVWGATLFFSMNRPPDNAIDIQVVGKRWMWKLQHMTGQREINELHVPAGRPVRLTLTSEDVIHSFFVPAFRMKKDAVPGRYNVAWFEATRPGRYHLFCAEYCGTQHSRMIGWIVVMEPADFQTWLQGGPAPTSPVEAGQKLFSELNCATCHRPDSQGRGPVLDGVAGSTVRLANGETVTADEGYLRESILVPAAKVTDGYQPIMPTYQGQVSEEAVLQLIAYIQSLKGPGGAAGAGSK
ncbi:MAG TPA: cytochrome c oxidase subunit II [Vicinamibacteria bacterium]|nr:cytochrome c oxidase subunit II [Vicinamibacteria bacterium]